MWKVRNAFVAIIFPIGAIVLLVQHYSTSVPSLDQLTKVTGELTLGTEQRSTYNAYAEQTIFAVGRSTMHFRYLDSFPQADRITTLVKEGEEITIWTDRGKNNWVWQIEQGGSIITSYEDVRATIVSDAKDIWMRASVLLFVGAVAGIQFYRQTIESA